MIYFTGIGVEENSDIAVKWCSRAARVKLPLGMFYLGMAYSIGDSVETLAQDMPIEGFGLEWFELLNKTKRGTPLETGQHVRIITK